MLSFDDNIHLHSLPPFANDQNKALSKQIRSKETALSSLLAVLDDNTSRADSMVSHLKNVQQEIRHTQGIFDAKTRQIETEDHLKQIAEREGGRLSLEIKSIEKEIAEITDHNNIYKGNEKIETIRTELKLEKEELDEWLRVQSEKEEDNFALLKYTKEDDIRIKELNLATEKLMTEVNKRKSILSAEVTETQVAQIELDKTTEEFKRLHMERQDLINQWETALRTMQNRDHDITDSQDRYQKSKDDIKDKQSIIDEKQAFLDNQLQNNIELEKRIGVLDRTVSKFRFRAELSQEQSHFSQFQDDVDVLRTTLNKTSSELQNKRNEIQNMKSDLRDKQMRLDKEKEKRVNLRDKLAKVTGETMTLEAKAHELQEILKEEEYQITGGEAALKNLRSNIHNKLFYTAQEFQIQQLERKSEEHRQAKRKMDGLQKEGDSVKEEIDELNLYTDSASHQLNAKVREKEELMVEENILRLELRKLRGFLNAKADEVFGLESRQIQLQLALEERTKEITIHNDMLRVQTKNVEEERHSACAELRERVGKVEKLRRRYEILMTQFAPEEGEEEHSQAFYVIRAAQEKEALQREGDELDAKIRKAEKEIKALENTLRLMNDRNENYRMNLYRAELNATDVQHKEMLEQQYQTAMERYKAKRNEIQMMQYNLQELERALSNLSSDESARIQAITVIENKLASMDKELKDQESKRERAYKSAVRYSKELRKAVPESSKDEIDFKIRECKDLGNLVLTELTKIMEQYPEIVNRVSQLYTESQGFHHEQAPSAMTLAKLQVVVAAVVAPPPGPPPGLPSPAAVEVVLYLSVFLDKSPASLLAVHQVVLDRDTPQAVCLTVQLPPKVPERTGFGGSTTESPTPSEKMGSITGAKRIKKPARPSSVASSASINSLGSRNSKEGSNR
ncbi:hypothetical protein BC829DRAFT_414156 [Chytridium lagenaria]|nr:hypothetical protein BC829DRAFT_414156 [Chytridium lagenaria]